MRVLLDNNISPLVARAIHILVEAEGDRAAALRDEFPADAPDVQWIGELGRRGAWSSSRATCRSLGGPRSARPGDLPDWSDFLFEPGWSRFKNTEKAARLLLWWPRIREQAGLVAGGAMFQLPIKAGSKLKQLQVERR